jgi:hypothetical protein
MYGFPYLPCRIRISLCENKKRIFEWSGLKMSYIKIIIDEKCIVNMQCHSIFSFKMELNFHVEIIFYSLIDQHW